jgi:hypothetical protein
LLGKASGEVDFCGVNLHNSVVFANRGLGLGAAVPAAQDAKITNAEISVYSFIRAYKPNVWHVLKHGRRHGLSEGKDIVLQLDQKDIALQLVRPGPERIGQRLEGGR